MVVGSAVLAVGVSTKKEEERQEKKDLNVTKRYISPIWGEAPRHRSVTLFGVSTSMGDVITHAKFHKDRLIGSRDMSGRIFSLPIGIHSHPYHCVTHYRAFT
jgi:hypothetical protein